MDARIPRTKPDRWAASVAPAGHLEHGEGGGLPRLALLRGVRSSSVLVRHIRHPGQTAGAVRRRAGEGMLCLAH